MPNLNDKTNIPLYNDEKINREIEKRKKQEEYEKRKKEEEQKKAEKKALKMSRFPISEMPFLMQLSICFMVSIIGISIYKEKYLYILQAIIGIVTVVYIGKRLKFKFDDTLNVLVWNISQTFKDFIDYKLQLDFFSGSVKRVKLISIIFSLVLVFVNSSNIIYDIFFGITIVIYLISFANREMEVLASNSKAVSLGAFFGLIIKTILYSIITGGLSVDFMNVFVIIVFSSISSYTSNLPIFEPED